MKTTRPSLLVTAAVAASLLVACNQGSSLPFSSSSASPDTAACPLQGADDAASPKLYVFSDATGLRSRVERTRRPDGSETLHGVTDVPLPSARVTEYVEIDAAGRLVYADVSLARPGPGRSATAVKRLIADAQRGIVQIRRDGHATTTWRLPVQEPWVYTGFSAAPSETDSGAVQAPADVPVPTAVAAWVTFRAAEAAPGLRMIDGEKLVSHEIAADQVVVRGDGDYTILLGDNAVSASDDFVVALRPGAEPMRLTQIDPGLGQKVHAPRAL